MTIPAHRSIIHPKAAFASLLAVTFIAPSTVHSRNRHTLPMQMTSQATDSEPTGDDENFKNAMSAYKNGVALYNKAEYEAALAAFFDAQSLFPSPDFQYNIARCYERLQKYEEAIRYYQAYLRNKPEAEDRANIESQIKQLEARLNEQKGESPPPANDPPVSQAVDQPFSPKPARPLIISGAVLLGVGSVFALSGGIGFGLQATDRQQKIDELNAGNNPNKLTLSQALDLEKQGKNAQIGQIVSISAGSAIAIIGGVLLGIGLQRKHLAQQKTALLPSVGPHMTGFVLQGRF